MLAEANDCTALPALVRQHILRAQVAWRRCLDREACQWDDALGSAAARQLSGRRREGRWRSTLKSGKTRGYVEAETVEPVCVWRIACKDPEGAHAASATGVWRRVLRVEL